MGDIFRFFGHLFLMSPHFTILMYPPLSFSWVSSLRYFCAAFTFADMCGPRFSAASIIGFVHGVPVSTGHPFVL